MIEALQAKCKETKICAHGLTEKLEASILEVINSQAELRKELNKAQKEINQQGLKAKGLEQGFAVLQGDLDRLQDSSRHLKGKVNNSEAETNAFKENNITINQQRFENLTKGFEDYQNQTSAHITNIRQEIQEQGPNIAKLDQKLTSLARVTYELQDAQSALKERLKDIIKEEIQYVQIADVSLQHQVDAL
ncbi:uncharacterized protein N0V89_004396 [Didymosphaeria variabile]|uniref:Uncharacterized protein n=1 Tax=Didymosphaeria variabile TaxID=1932322 RepID=A0A9W9CCD2_9PLEO|nr:uncharacterized protein N0V89_004396 [Didymosphaeria variabile]KAJ4356364.1 hypothetical protein N0V89_004396 [Didymosphaeria variabile]